MSGLVVVVVSVRLGQCAVWGVILHEGGGEGHAQELNLGARGHDPTNLAVTWVPTVGCWVLGVATCKKPTVLTPPLSLPTLSHLSLPRPVCSARARALDAALRALTIHMMKAI